MKVLLLAFCIPFFFYAVPQPKKIVKKKRVVKVRKVEPIVYRVPAGSINSYAQGYFNK